MAMHLDDVFPVKTNGKTPQITRRRIQIEGVQIFDQFYFHPDLSKFINESVEVRYDALDKSRVEIVLPDYRVIEAETLSIVQNDDQYIDDAFELIQVRAALLRAEAENQSLKAACHQALEISRIFTDLFNPLTGETEKVELRLRHAEIVNNIRAAIKNGGEK